ncbi:MAG TPA: site-2 protease family protein [Candidatus Sulfotelmatobacter sp.]|nr:site-2 protease family protein [Candidatus Sulfotelmatobacter sp.]
MIPALQQVGGIVLVAFVVLSIVIVVHELGHFVFAKLFGIHVDEFALGFGPRLLSRRRGETVYAIRAIPAGGFVRMAGMLGLEGETDAGERNFLRASIPRRLVVMFAGIAFNLVFAAPCFAFYEAAPTPSKVAPEEPAYRAGIRDGDVIVSMNGVTIDHQSLDTVSADLHRATASSEGKPMPTRYRDSRGASHATVVTPELLLYNGVSSDDPAAAPIGGLVVTAVNGKPVGTGDPAAVLGGGQVAARISGFIQNSQPRATFSDAVISGVVDGDQPEQGKRVAAWRIGYNAGHEGESLPGALLSGFTEVGTDVAGAATGLYTLIRSPSTISSPQGGVAGPVGIALESNRSAREGLPAFIDFLGLISLNVGFLNLLPIPFLDGGRIALVLLEAVRRRRLDPRREAMIYAASLAVLVVFALYVTVGDINHIPDYLRSP